jgi:ribosomal protein S27AE
MRCPECGVEMNHHAEKLVYPSTPAEAELAHAAWGGWIEQIHCCPECGGTQSRRAP